MSTIVFCHDGPDGGVVVVDLGDLGADGLLRVIGRTTLFVKHDHSLFDHLASWTGIRHSRQYYAERGHRWRRYWS